MSLVLSWDGSDLGDITYAYIKIRKPAAGRVGAVLTLQTKAGRVKCLAWSYKNDIPLVIDELKPILGLAKIGRHKCVIDGTKLLLAQRLDPAENAAAKEDGDGDSVRYYILFRYFFGVITRGSFLWHRPSVGVISYKECTVSFTRQSSTISEANVKKWFGGNRNNVITAVRKLLKRLLAPGETSLVKLVQLLRIYISDTIRRVNSDLIEIASGFMERIQTYLTHIVCLEIEEGEREKDEDGEESGEEREKRKKSNKSGRLTVC